MLCSVPAARGCPSRRCSVRRARRVAATGGDSEEPVEKANDLTALWKRDISFMDERGRSDTRRAFDGLAFSTELFRSVFGKGERPALQQELAKLRAELEVAHTQAHLSELRLAHTSARVTELERSARVAGGASAQQRPASQEPTLPAGSQPARTSERNYWYPLAHASSLGTGSPLALWFLDRPWALFRDAQGQPGCVLDECAHRACPLSLGKVVDGRLQCPYHGWEYGPGGACSHMPSCTFLPGVAVQALPCVEQDGLLWAWAGDADETPSGSLPRFAPPPSFVTVATVALEVPHPPEAVIQALMAGAEQPAGCGEGRSLRQAQALAGPSAAPADAAQQKAGSYGATVGGAAARALLGPWEAASPVSVAFEPPCSLLSTLRLESQAPGALSEASLLDADAGEEEEQARLLSTRQMQQLHVCLPSEGCTTRVLYRLALNYSSWGAALMTSSPGAPALWHALAEEVLREQLALLEPQLQHRAQRGEGGSREAYRRWRDSVKEAAV